MIARFFVTSMVTAALFSTTSLLADTITLTEDALKLHHSSLLIDGHNDLPWELRANGDSMVTHHDLNSSLPKFHTDIPRLRKGGMGAQFWSVYVPVTERNPFDETKKQMDIVGRMIVKYPDAFARALSTADIRSAVADKKIASLMGVEGGHCIENSLAKLNELYKLGARYMTLTHSTNTDWADSATDREVHHGLTDFGKQVVREMNRLGMLVDISHVSEKTMRDAIVTSTVPVIASHSSAYAITPHPRNVPDSILRLIKERDGVIMVNFYTKYIEHGDRSDVDTLVDHIDHIAQVAGAAHVGIGSDFDGVPSLPAQLTDVSYYPYITQALLNRGYSHEDIRLILGENLMRVFSVVEAGASR